MRIKPLHRRTVLRGMLCGASAAVALPLLEAMLDENGEALADGSDLPCRFMTFMFGNGVRLNRFIPTQQYPNTYQLSDELAPFANVKDYLTVLTGFNNHSAYFITHHEGNTVFSGHDIKDVGQGPGFFSNAGGPTIDQVIAALPSVGDQTAIRSIQVGISKKPSNVDHGTTTHAVSHKDYLQPLPPEFEPKAIWTSLFDSFVPPEDPQGDLRLSVLDIVKEKIGGLKKRLGTADIARLDAHLQGISELETKIEALPPLCETPMQPTIDNIEVGGVEPLTAVCDAMSDLIVMAFKCDVTRVASCLFSEPASNTVYSELGHTNAHHNQTHMGSVQDTLVHDGVVYTMERIAYLLERMKAEEDPTGGNLLDSFCLFASSDVSEGYSHSIDDQPMILAGKLRDKLIYPGIHYRSATGENPTNVLLSLAQSFDPGISMIGSGATQSNTPFNLIKAP